MLTIGVAVLASKFGERPLGGKRNASRIGALAGATLDGAMTIWAVQTFTGIIVSPLILFLLPLCFKGE